MNSPLLILLLLIPAAGALIGALLPIAAARSWALLISVATLLVGIVIACEFQYGFFRRSSQFSRLTYPHLALPFGSSFSLGIDTIALWLVLLTVLLMPLSIAASLKVIKDRPREYYSWMLLLLAAMLGVFVTRDMLLFYIFFELTLVPMFFIIGIWGGPERRCAAGKFFLFTFTGSVFTLAAVDLSRIPRRHVRYRRRRRLCPQSTSPIPSDSGFAGPARRLRREGAAVPGAYLAAAGSHRGPDGRLASSSPACC